MEITIKDLLTSVITIVGGIVFYFSKKRIDKVNFNRFILKIEDDRKKAKKSLSTIEVHGKTNVAYVAERDLLKLMDPLEYMDDKIKSSLDSKLSDQFVGLSRMIREHNAEMERFGGAFGADSYRNILITRLRSIMMTQEQIINILKNKSH